MKEQIKPGVHLDLSNESYHGHRASYSKSSLSDFSVYPYNLIYQRQNRVRKLEFDMGTSAHTAILEPEKWEGSIAVIPPSVLTKNGQKRGKKWDEWKATVPTDKPILTMAQRDAVLRMRDSVHENPGHSRAKELLTGGQAEVSAFWEEQFKGEETDDDTGYRYMVSDQYGDPGEDSHTLMMKCRPDYIPVDWTQPVPIIADLKTEGTAIDRESWERRACNLHYPWSAALTLRGMTMATGKQHRVYIFVVVESNPPHEVAVYRASEEFIAYGRKEVMRTMQHLAWCDKHDKWPGVPNRIQTIGLPGYVYKKLFNDE